MSLKAGLQNKTLGTMDKEELQSILKSIEVDYEDKDTNLILESRIIESGRYSGKKENTGGTIKIDKKTGKKIHPTLGKYIKVRVHPTSEHNAKSSIFCSINLYTIEFHPNEIVELPIKVVKYLKELGDPSYYYDANYITENGNLGAHRTRMTPKYIVEVVSELLED